MGQKFISADRYTLYLFPPSVQDWLPENHLARFVVDIISQLALKPITDSYAGKGSKAHHPQILLGILFYGYATGVFSSRKIERATYESVAFRYIAANTHPDHDTISNFRKRFLEQLQPLFVQILLLAREMGILKLGKVSLDGTKIQANASKHHALSWEHACKIEQQLKEEVANLMKMAEQTDSSDASDGMDLPNEIARREDRLAAIAEAKKKIEQRADERYKQEKEQYDEKIEKRQAQEAQTGKKPRGTPPTPPIEGPRPQDQVNLTDEQSRIMPTSGKNFIQAYNAQAAVDMGSMLVVENHVSQAPNDKKELDETLAGLDNLPKELGEVDALAADNGYLSNENVIKTEQAGITPYIAVGREKHHQSPWERFAEPAPLPENPCPVEKMKHRLKTKEGRAIYAQRKSTVEPVFGIIKHVIGFRQFLLRGLEAVRGEWNLVSTAYNLKRMFALIGK